MQQTNKIKILKKKHKIWREWIYKKLQDYF